MKYLITESLLENMYDYNKLIAKLILHLNFDYSRSTTFLKSKIKWEIFKRIMSSKIKHIKNHLCLKF